MDHESTTSGLMRFALLLLVLLVSSALDTRAQNTGITGVQGVTVEADTGMPLEGAHITLTSRQDSTLTWGGVSRNDGAFEVLVPNPGPYHAHISVIGFVAVEEDLVLSRTVMDLGTVKMEAMVLELDDVVVEARRPAMEVNGDTLAFSAASYQTRPDAMVEDLVKKLPGLRIEDGTVYINGEPVERIMLDGQEFFGTDVMFALQTLPVEIVQSLQVYDKMSDQAEFTGFDDGNSQKTINIVTRRDRRNGQLGQAYGGMGSESRYRAGFNVNHLNGSRRVTAVGRSSNISGGGRRGGSSGGITKSHSLNLNYNDVIDDRLTINGSYSLGLSNTDGNVLLSRQYFLSDNTSQFYDESNISRQDNASHRLRGRIKYELDGRNAITFSPNLSLSLADSRSNITGLTMLEELQKLNSTVNENASSTDQLGGSMNLLVQHRFAKEGRTISANVSVGLNRGDGYSMLHSEDIFYAGDVEDDFTRQRTSRDQNGRSTGLRLSYTEPLGKNRMLEISYRPSVGTNASDRIARMWDDGLQEYVAIEPGLSNKYDNENTTHQAGLSLNQRGEKLRLSLGLEYEDYLLRGDQTYPYVYDVRQHFQSMIPHARVDVNFSKTRTLRIDYRARTRTPSVSQLQPVIDNTNPIQLSSGNPDLKQSTVHSVYLRFRTTNPETGRSLSGNVSASATRDYIGRESIVAEEDTDLGDGVILRQGSRLTRPVNMEGLWSLRSSGTYSFPVDAIKSNLYLDADYSFNRSPGVINGIENVSLRHTVGGELSVRSNMGDRIDFNLEYGASYNFVDNTVRTRGNDNYLRHRAGAEFELYPWEPFEINTRFRLSHYSRADNLGTETIQWNAGVSYRFLAQNAGQIALSVEDILDQGNNFSRNVNELYVEDNLSHVLGRYLLFSFTYRVRQFGR